MEKNCKNCKLFDSLCSVICPFPEVGCSEFVSKQKKFVLVHHYLETGKFSVVSFSDSYDELIDVGSSHPRFHSSRHRFSIVFNLDTSVVDIDGNRCRTLLSIKDESLLSISKNVAEYLSIAEYAMLKKSYSKASSWFEKAKNSAFLGSVIIDNY